MLVNSKLKPSASDTLIVVYMDAERDLLFREQKTLWEKEKMLGYQHSPFTQ